jgi:hypothetical protein
MAPEQEAAFRQGGDGDADVMEGELFFLPEASFTIEKIAVADAEGQMYDRCGPIARKEHNETDAQKENDLYQAEEKIDPWEEEQIPARQHQDKDVQRDEELTPEINGRHLVPMDMAKGMGKDKNPGGGMQPFAGTL